MTASAKKLYKGVFPVAPTVFDADGRLDLEGQKRAIDFMINGDSSLGQAIADWARAHAAELNLYDVIWRQHIWTPVRASEGWRFMPSRGSITANHYDDTLQIPRLVHRH